MKQICSMVIWLSSPVIFGFCDLANGAFVVVLAWQIAGCSHFSAATSCQSTRGLYTVTGS